MEDACIDEGWRVHIDLLIMKVSRMYSTVKRNRMKARVIRFKTTCRLRIVKFYIRDK